MEASRPVLSAYAEVNWIKVTGSPISYRNHHLCQQDIDIIDMDGVRKPFSKMRKGFKHRFGSKRREPDGAETNIAGESVSSSASFLRPDHHVVVSGHGEEGSRIGTDVSQAHPRDLSHPEPMQADEGHIDDPPGEEVDVDEKEVGRGDSNLDPGVGGAVGSSPGRVIKQEPDSTWTLSPQLPCLTIRLGNADIPAVHDHTPQDLRSDEDAEPSAAANEKKSSWKSTAFATTKLLLRGVRDSADAFGPLKSVAGGLCFILENCEVCPSPAYAITTLTGAPADEGE